MSVASESSRPVYTSGEAPRATKHLLLVSYFFPPVNVVGSLRWLRIAQYAAHRGWSFDVVMVHPTGGSSVDPASTMAVDMEKLAELPRGVNVYQVSDRTSWLYAAQRSIWQMLRPIVRRRSEPSIAVRTTPPTRLQRESTSEGEGEGEGEGRSRRRAAYLTRLHYGEFRRWARDAARVAAHVVRERRPNIIASSGPPHSAHEAARQIAARTGIPWVMDMRDPWGAPENTPADFAGPTWTRMTGQLEGRCVEAAKLVLLNTEAARRELASRYPDRADRFITVMNGADPLRNELPVTRSTRFTIAYAGNIYVGRDPTVFFAALARVIRDLSLTPDQVGADFFGGGDYARDIVLSAAREAGIASFVTHTPHQSHREALAFLSRAPMLLNLPQHHHLAIPAKIFEYVQMPSWLLILAEAGSATELLLRDSTADVLDPRDVDGIAERLRCRFLQHARSGGERPSPVNASGRFDRDRQSQILLDALAPLA